MTDPSNYRREQFGYTVPIIDSTNIASPVEVFASPGVLWINLLLALLFTLVIGLARLIMNRLLTLDAARLKQILERLPLQAVMTLLLSWLLTLLLPQASAQGFSFTSQVSLLHVPYLAFLFFLVIGISNFIFNNIITSEGDAVHELFIRYPLLARFFRPGEADRSRERWLIVIVLIAYGIVGTHINPSFSILPTPAEIGMALIATLAILIAAYTKDSLRFFIAKVWKCSTWFKANISGLLLAIICVFVSRSLKLSPGYIYGLPVGLFIVSAIYDRHEGIFEFFGLLWMMILALIAWIAAPMLSSYQVLHDFLLLIFIILAEAAFFEMLPLRYLSGGSIFRWRKSLWALEFTLVVFLLFQTTLNPGGTIASIQQSPPAITAVMLLGAYAAFVLILWAYLLLKRVKSPNV